MPSPKLDLQVARTYIDDLRSDAEAFHQQKAAIDAKADLSAEARSRQIAALTAQYHAQRRTDVEYVQQKLSQVTADAAALLTAEPGDVGQQLMLSRAAHRVARLISADTPLALITTALSEGKDLHGLRALLEEIPAVSARLDNQEQREALVRDATTAIHQAMRPMVRGQEAEAIDALNHLPAERECLDAINEYAASSPLLSRVEIAQDLADDSARRTGFAAPPR